jgi:hypothetical protein
MKSAGKQPGRKLTFPVKGRNTEETIPMKQTWRGNKGWSGYLAGKNSTQGGDR